MWKALICGFVLRFATGVYADQPVCNISHASDLLNAVLRTLQYADAYKTELNLDGAAGVRMVADQIKILNDIMETGDYPGKKEILMRLDYLTAMSDAVSKEAITFLKAIQPDYFNVLGGLLKPGLWNLHYYQDRSINKKLQRKPMLCSESVWVESHSDHCLSELLGPNSGSSVSASSSAGGPPGPGACNISLECIQSMTDHGNRDYPLTHQVLYLQVAEANGCVPTLEKMGYTDPEILAWQEAFCANVYRDAEDIAKHNYPTSHRDLFLEQIALCGMYGFDDFWRDDWTSQALKWQEINGCFRHNIRWRCQDNLNDGRRVKRMDKQISDGCSSHMTAVGLFALFTNLRYCLISILKDSLER